MNNLSTTRNQHFLSQVEQRFNSCNKNADSINQRIFSFIIEDKENYIVRLENKKGIKIRNNLVFSDLYSFEVIGKRTRRNLEEMFCKYEKRIEETTNALIKKLKENKCNVVDEVCNIFVLKFVNFIRNPYCISKVISTFKKILNHYPTDPDIQKEMKRIVNGRKPHQQHICKKLNINEDIYVSWIKLLYFLLSDGILDSCSILEKVLLDKMENKNYKTFIHVNFYNEEEDDKRCILSDRGFFIPYPEEKCESYSFNLFSNAFIDYIFFDLNSICPNGEIKRAVLDRERKKEIDLRFTVNDLRQLERYNKGAIYFSHERVYSSYNKIYGA